MLLYLLWHIYCTYVNVSLSSTDDDQLDMILGVWLYRNVSLFVTWNLFYELYVNADIPSHRVTTWDSVPYNTCILFTATRGELHTISGYHHLAITMVTASGDLCEIVFVIVQYSIPVFFSIKDLHSVVRRYGPSIVWNSMCVSDTNVPKCTCTDNKVFTFPKPKGHTCKSAKG